MCTAKKKTGKPGRAIENIGFIGCYGPDAIRFFPLAFPVDGVPDGSGKGARKDIHPVNPAR